MGLSCLIARHGAVVLEGAAGSGELVALCAVRVACSQSVQVVVALGWEAIDVEIIALEGCYADIKCPASCDQYQECSLSDLPQIINFYCG